MTDPIYKAYQDSRAIASLDDLEPKESLDDTLTDDEIEALECDAADARNDYD